MHVYHTKHSLECNTVIPIILATPGMITIHFLTQTNTFSICSEPSTSTTTHTVKPVRVKTVKRSSTPEVIKLPKSLSLGLILTDNINVTGGLVQEKYPKNQDKIWQIRIPPNCRMNIYFSEFLIESSDTCSKDYFSVQTSKNQQDIPRYCDTLHRIEIRNRRRVQLYFHTDDSVEKRGIIASVCLSNWPETGDNQLPCTCTSGRRRRSARSEESSCKLFPIVTLIGGIQVYIILTYVSDTVQFVSLSYQEF